MKINVQVAAGLNEFLKNEIAAAIQLSARLQPHPADLCDMNFAIRASFR